MNTVAQFNTFCSKCSDSLTRGYSTSFYSAIQLLRRDIRDPICAIYGMVRLADEIVDTFHSFDKEGLLTDFRNDTFKAIKAGISLNPILQNFQLAVHKYTIADDLINAFFDSMAKDLTIATYQNESDFKNYIYGSAEVVGLMCLNVFCEGDRELFNSLKKYAKALGSAFQKVNFLRDLQSDIEDLERSYFPSFKSSGFNTALKSKIERDIEDDFKLGHQGIKKLPLNARFGVYVAYRYYLALFEKLKRTNSTLVLEKRIRIPNHMKMVIVLKAGLRSQLNLI
ncbi:phytoene/squalene synthase family protein [Paradesertivirga mongoliensis]|uniref:Phytoene/squalene synthase family protein n=1 Tax=Paradesertivirga mongoliensis TaxID=2100740 RepID=A0ABW4ZIK7_9SPHI|nr:phytoene/squalene synthase family protein [Pedobacter mongoliensis]